MPGCRYWRTAVTHSMLPSRLPPDLRERHRRIYAAAVESARDRGWDPDGALEAGFLDEVVADGEATERALAVATELAELPGAAYATNKLMSRKASIAIARADIAKLSAA